MSLPQTRRVPLIIPLVVADTTFVHETFNYGNDDVYLFLVDFWHPDLSVDEIEAFRMFLKLNSNV